MNNEDNLKAPGATNDQERGCVKCPVGTFRTVKTNYYTEMLSATHVA